MIDMRNLIILDWERRHFPTSNKILFALYTYLEDKYLKTIYNFFIIPKLKKYIKQKNTRIIAADKETEIFLNRKNIPFSVINQYVKGSDFSQYRKIAIDFIRNLPNSVPDIDVKYVDISLWKTDELYIYESFLKPIITHIEIIKKIIKIENPSKLVILNSSSKSGIIQKMFKDKIKIEDKTDIISKSKKIIFKVLMPFAVRTIYSEFIKKIKHPKYKPKKSNEIIFFESERGFGYSEPFLEKKKGKLTILQDGEYNKKRQGYNYDLLENYLNKESKQRLLQFKKTLKKSFSKLKKSDLRYDLKYKGVTLYGVLEDMFEYLFDTSYLRSAYYCECFNNFFKYNRPKLLITMCEIPKIHKIALNISKKHKSKSLFVMHGAFGVNYLYDHLLSNKVAVYGQEYKKILVGMGNNPDKIVVTGNPAWDYLIKTKFNKEKITSMLNIPKDKKIFLLATVHFPSESRDRLAYSVIKTMAKLPAYHLVIKLHPEEKPSFYQELLKRYNLTATITDQLSLLHHLISISEVVIISNSTVGLETLILDKPLIDVNLTEQPYYQDYVDKKVALGVRKEKDMLSAIRSILEEKNVRERLKKNRKGYVYEHAYKQDGKSSDRITKLINKILAE